MDSIDYIYIHTDALTHIHMCTHKAVMEHTMSLRERVGRQGFGKC